MEKPVSDTLEICSLIGKIESEKAAKYAVCARKTKLGVYRGDARRTKGDLGAWFGKNSQSKLRFKLSPKDKQWWVGQSGLLD